MTVYSYPVNSESLRVPIGKYKDIKESLELRDKITDILGSDQPFNVLLESGKIPYPLKIEGLNYTGYMLKAIEQAISKLKEKGIKIIRIDIVRGGSLANNRWMLGSDIDGMRVYVDGEIPAEMKIFFSSMLKRCGMVSEELDLDSKIRWERIQYVNSYDVPNDYTTIYEYGELKQPMGISSAIGEIKIRQKLFELWNNGSLSQDEKDILAKAYKIAALRITSQKRVNFNIYESEKNKVFSILYGLQAKGLVQMIDGEYLYLNWLKKGKSAMRIVVKNNEDINKEWRVFVNGYNSYTKMTREKFLTIFKNYFLGAKEIQEARRFADLIPLIPVTDNNSIFECSKFAGKANGIINTNGFKASFITIPSPKPYDSQLYREVSEHTVLITKVGGKFFLVDTAARQFEIINFKEILEIENRHRGITEEMLSKIKVHDVGLVIMPLDVILNGELYPYHSSKVSDELLYKDYYATRDVNLPISVELGFPMIQNRNQI